MFTDHRRELGHPVSKSQKQQAEIGMVALAFKAGEDKQLFPQAARASGSPGGLVIHAVAPVCHCAQGLQRLVCTDSYVPTTIISTYMDQLI